MEVPRIVEAMKVIVEIHDRNDCTPEIKKRLVHLSDMLADILVYSFGYRFASRVDDEEVSKGKTDGR